MPCFAQTPPAPAAFAVRSFVVEGATLIAPESTRPPHLTSGRIARLRISSRRVRRSNRSTRLDRPRRRLRERELGRGAEPVQHQRQRPRLSGRYNLGLQPFGNLEQRLSLGYDVRYYDNEVVPVGTSTAIVPDYVPAAVRATRHRHFVGGPGRARRLPDEREPAVRLRLHHPGGYALQPEHRAGELQPRLGLLGRWNDEEDSAAGPDLACAGMPAKTGAGPARSECGSGVCT